MARNRWTRPLLVASVAAFGACAQPPSPPLDLGEALRFALAERALVSDVLRLPGESRLGDGARSTIASPQPGRVERWLVAVGDRVAQGQVLAVLRPHAASSPATAAALGEARQRVSRTRELDALGLVARAEREAAERDLGHLELAVARQLESVPIVAPIAGVVSEVYAPLDTNLAAGGAIATVVDDSRLVVAAGVPPALASSLTQGMAARIRFPDSTDAEIGAALQHLAPMVDPLSGLVAVTFELGQRPVGVLPGMSAVVTITRSAPRSAVVVPRTALVLVGGETFVVVRGAGTPVARRVRANVLDDGRVEIVEGLDGGESVAIEGAELWVAPDIPTAPADGSWLLAPKSFEPTTTAHVLPFAVALDAVALATARIELQEVLDGNARAHSSTGIRRSVLPMELESLRFTPDGQVTTQTAQWQPASTDATKLTAPAPVARQARAAHGPTRVLVAVAGALLLVAAPLSLRATAIATLAALFLALFDLSPSVLAPSMVALAVAANRANQENSVSPGGRVLTASAAILPGVLAVWMPLAVIAVAASPTLATLGRLGAGLLLALVATVLVLATGRGETRSLLAPTLARISPRLSLAFAVLFASAGLALPPAPDIATVPLRTEGMSADPVRRTIAELARFALERGAAAVTSIATHGDLDHLVIEAGDARRLAGELAAILPPALDPFRARTSRVLHGGTPIAFVDPRVAEVALTLASDRVRVGDDWLELEDPAAWRLLRIGSTSSPPLYASALDGPAIRLVAPSPRPPRAASAARTWLAPGLALGGVLVVLAPYFAVRRRMASPRIAWDEARPVVLRGILILAGITAIAAHTQPFATLARIVLIAFGLGWAMSALVALGAQRSHRPSTRI